MLDAEDKNRGFRCCCFCCGYCYCYRCLHHHLPSKADEGGAPPAHDSVLEDPRSTANIGCNHYEMEPAPGVEEDVAAAVAAESAGPALPSKPTAVAIAMNDYVDFDVDFDVVSCLMKDGTFPRLPLR